MNLDIRPTLSALMRNRTAPLLVALQIAISLAVVVNAVYVVKQRIDRVNRPTGIDVENILVISTDGFTARYDHNTSVRTDLDYLRGLDGVIAASSFNAVPLSGGGSSTQLYVDPARNETGVEGNYFEVDEQGLDALGAHLSAGRNFRSDEILPALQSGNASEFVPSILVTQAFADALFPGQNALGKTVFTQTSGQPAKIIGIVDHMHGSWPNNDRLVDRVFFEPRGAHRYGMFYLARTRPGMRDAVMRQADDYLSTSNPERVVKFVRPLSSYRDRSYLNDRNMEATLATITGLILCIIFLGIFGLGTYNVNTRTKQIGTRRAVGARRGDILRYFLIENALITTAGICAGCALALAFGNWLSRQYSLPRLDLYYLVGGVLMMWIIGVLAAWQPAHKASGVAPSVATRTV